MDHSFPADGPARDRVNAEMKWAVPDWLSTFSECFRLPDKLGFPTTVT
jgi:hypothetical protein